MHEAVTAVIKLLGGGPSTLGSGPFFIEETYRAAKPHFQRAWATIKEAGGHLNDFLREIVTRARAAYGAQRERHKDALQAMLRRFALLGLWRSAQRRAPPRRRSRRLGL